MATWLVIPAFNEDAVLGSTLSSAMDRFGRNIVVVDDKSTDYTRLRAIEAGVHVCSHPINLGQGAALQTGIDYALSQGADCIVTFDADGQHRPEDAAAMVEEFKRSGVDILLASRFLGGTEGMSASRGRMLKVATFFTRLTTGLNLTDTHNGLRILGVKAARAIRLKQNRMAHASELLSQIAELGLSYKEYPVTIIYTEYSKAKGQRMTGAFAVILDLYIRRMYR